MTNSKITIKGKFGEVFGLGKNLNVGKNKTTNKLWNNIPNKNLNEINKNTIEESRNESRNNKNDLNIKINRSNYNPSTFSDTDKETEKMLERKESLSLGITSLSISPFRMIYMALIVAIILIIVLLFFYKDMFVDFFENIFGLNQNAQLDAVNSAKMIKSTNDAASTSQNTSAKLDNTSSKVDSTSAKVDNTSAKVDLTSAKVESTSAKIDDLDKKVDKLITKTCPTSSTESKESGINKLNNKLNDISPYKEANVTSDGYCYIGYDNGQRECVDVYAGDVCMSGEIFPSLDICINPKLRP
jgi:hypothetical protein